MSLQTLWLLIDAQPGQWLNGLALFLALAGSWLLSATRLREQRAFARFVVSSELSEMVDSDSEYDEPTLRLNRFFYRFGYACMVSALLLSWGSTLL